METATAAGDGKNGALDRRVSGLTTLLTLEKEARHAKDPEILGHLLVNESLRLLRYGQAVFWRFGGGGRSRIAAVSGVARFDVHAPQVVWLDGVIRILAALPAGGEIRELDVDSARADGVDEQRLREWPEWSFPRVLWLPLKDPRDDTVLGGLWLAREAAWEEGERVLAGHLADGYGHALALLESRRKPGRSWLGRLSGLLKVVGLAALVAALFLVPVRLSVLAPASIGPIRPTVVAAPLDGVVERFHVEPNQTVTAGQLLLELDPTEIRGRHQVELEELALARAGYQKALRQTFQNPDSGAELASLRALIDKAAARAVHSERVLERMRIKSPEAGVAVFADVNDWLGRPVRVGERILAIADPQRVEISIDLPVADALVLEPGAEVRLFLNIAPLEPLTATLRYASYEARETGDGVLAHHLRATLAADTPPPRLGLKGTAKIYGEEVSLFLYLFRRPLSALRRLVGL